MVVLMATATAGYALLPDLDHRSSTASRLLGPLTTVASAGLRRASAAVYQRTRTGADTRRDGQHRHLAHTGLFAVAAGLLTALITALGGLIATLIVLAIGVLLATAALGDWVLGAVTGALLLAGLQANGPILAGYDTARAGLILGLLVAVGCLIHNLGDLVTHSGVPLLWPLRIRSQAWYRIRPPAALRFRAGGPAESLLIFPASVLLGGLLFVNALYPAAFA
ncbi:membrane protein [Longimycelium tulufanense]|uniref:Membrane protein n=2 Tax=Longimycelium tulufanense TaxID=907463 RepID=A0A8J3FXL3_9PSEU|nr:membrane protein [Longimycelium tulufanense]